MIANKQQAIGIVENKRKSIGITVTEAARRAEVNQATWQRMAKGDKVPSWDMLIIMANAVDIGVKVDLDHG